MNPAAKGGQDAGTQPAGHWQTRYVTFPQVHAGRRKRAMESSQGAFPFAGLRAYAIDAGGHSVPPFGDDDSPAGRITGSESAVKFVCGVRHCETQGADISANRNPFTVAERDSVHFSSSTEIFRLTVDVGLRSTIGYGDETANAKQQIPTRGLTTPTTGPAVTTPTTGMTGTACMTCMIVTTGTTPTTGTTGATGTPPRNHRGKSANRMRTVLTVKG